MTNNAQEELHQTKLIETLRKAVSRISLLAEGNDPELDCVVRQIRQETTKGGNAKAIQKVLAEAEPHLLNSDETRLNRAKQVRDTLHDLINLLEQQNKNSVPHSEKKALESLVRLHWQSSPQWPSLFRAYLELARNTLNPKSTETSNEHSFFQRIFRRAKSKSKERSNQELMEHIGHTLAALLSNLSLSSDYDEPITSLKAVLASSRDLQELPSLLDEVINLIVVSTGKTQEGLTNYLNQLNKQLASINVSIASNYKSQRTLIENREGFDSTLQQHVADTSLAAKNATDLDTLKTLIDERMGALSDTMTQYKQQMALQEKQSHQSIALLKSKVSRMEKDASSMRTSLQEKLAQAMTDALTNLPNRAAYQDTILPLFNSSIKNKQTLFLAVCDIDHFKQVNDTWGHQAGDKVLQLVTKQLRNTLAKDDMVFRYGGEEFVTILPNISQADAIKRVQSIRQSIEQTPFNVNGDPVKITISIGMACRQDNEDHESLFARADKQLYLAKESGRNNVKVEQTIE